MADELKDKDYRTLESIRFELRRFVRFSEQAAIAAGLTPQQHQALLAIRAAEDSRLLVGKLAKRLMIEPHSASELVRRLVKSGMVVRRKGGGDRRQVHIELTDQSRAILTSLSASHRAELRRVRPLLEHLLNAL